MVLSVGGSFAYFALSNTQNDFYTGAAICSTHILASPSGRNVKYDEKQLAVKKIFDLFLLSVQVS
jgi:hypothetical protein